MSKKCAPDEKSPVLQIQLRELDRIAQDLGAYLTKLIESRYRTVVYYVDPATDDPECFCLFNEFDLEFPDHDATIFIAVFRREDVEDANPTPAE